jgi:hypothetical protein
VDLDPAGDGGLCAEPGLAAGGMGDRSRAGAEQTRDFVGAPDCGQPASSFGTVARLSTRVVPTSAAGCAGEDESQLENPPGPLNGVMARALAHFSVVWILDGSTLDALLRKVGWLREGEGTVLAGRLGCLLNADSLLPEEAW